MKSSASYLQPLLSSPQRIEAFQPVLAGFVILKPFAILKHSEPLQVPTLFVWGLQDFSSTRNGARWLKDTIPGAVRVVEVEGARLFFPEDRPDALAGPILEFWDEQSGNRA